MATPQTRKPTIKDVARRAGASIAAVSYAINGNRFVSEQLSERIRKAIQDLEYTPSRMAQSLRRNRTQTIGLIMDDITNRFGALFTKGLESAAAEQQYTLIISDLHGSPANEPRSVNLLLDQRVDGIIYCGFGAEEARLRGIHAGGLPVVMADKPPRRRGFRRSLSTTGQACWPPWNTSGVWDTENILFINGEEINRNGRLRADAFREFMVGHGLEFAEDQIIYGDYTLEHGFQTATRIFERRGRFTAVFCGDDMIAFGVLAGLKARGLRIPEDVAVVGFGDDPISRVFDPSLTTIHYPMEEMGRQAFARFRKLIGQQRRSPPKPAVGNELAGPPQHRPELSGRLRSGAPAAPFEENARGGREAMNASNEARGLILAAVVAGLATFCSGPARGQGVRIPASPDRPWEPAQLNKLARFQARLDARRHNTDQSESTPQSIEHDFQAMAEEDNINYVRLAFWGCVPGKKIDYTLFDACFRSAQRHKIKLNPALPQIPGWQDGKSDAAEVRQTYKEHIQDRSSAATRTSRPWASGRWKWSLRGIGKRGLPRRLCGSSASGCRDVILPWRLCTQPSPAMHPSTVRFRSTIPQGRVEQLSGIRRLADFTCYALAEQVLFALRGGPEVDPAHPVSCTPPDVLHNQVIANGRNMWWLADAVDLPSHQMELHWHSGNGRYAPRPVCRRSVRAAQSLLLGRPGISYRGEFLAGPDLGESPRLFSTTAGELLGTALMHLAEGSKGFLYWLWNPLLEGPECRGLGPANLDGSPSQRSRLAARFGRMVCGTTICCTACAPPTRTWRSSILSTPRSICTAVPASSRCTTGSCEINTGFSRRGPGRDGLRLYRRTGVDRPGHPAIPLPLRPLLDLYDRGHCQDVARVCRPGGHHHRRQPHRLCHARTCRVPRNSRSPGSRMFSASVPLRLNWPTRAAVRTPGMQPLPAAISPAKKGLAARCRPDCCNRSSRRAVPRCSIATSRAVRW